MTKAFRFRAGIGAALLLSAGIASASGTHAGGHEHHHDASIGVPGKATKSTRTVDVEMTDAMRFVPDSFTAKAGETVRFRVRNTGKLKHEMVLGTDKALKEHYEVMKKFPDMEHSDPSMLTLAPGASGEIVWTFTRAGKVDFACLQPGHYDAGMKGQVTVAKQAAGQK